MSFPTPDALTTLSNVKALLGISDTSEDTLLNYLIPAASAIITQQCNRTHFLSTNAANPVTEYYSGSGDEWLILRQWPVQSITSIYLDDLFYWGQTDTPNSASLLVQGTDYALAIDTVGGASRSGMVYRINNIWDTQWTRDGGMLASYPTSGRGNIQVTYTCGFQSLPADLNYVASVVVARMRNSSKFGRALNSESYEEYSYNLAQDVNAQMGLLGGEIAPVIAKYRIADWGVAV